MYNINQSLKYLIHAYLITILAYVSNNHNVTNKLVMTSNNQI